VTGEQPTPRELSRRRFQAALRKRSLRDDLEGHSRIQAYIFLALFFGVLPLIFFVQLLVRAF
jgi:hypothetical protein